MKSKQKIIGTGIFRIMALLACYLAVSASWSVENRSLEILLNQFKQSSRELGIPALQLSYIDNLSNIANADSRLAQEKIFNELQAALTEIDIGPLSQTDNDLYQHLAYRLGLHLQRLKLENQFKAQIGEREVTSGGIYHQLLGRDWYRYYLQAWLSIEKSPEWLMQFGEREVAKVQKQFADIQQRTGFGNDVEAFYRHISSPTFFLNNKEEVLKVYRDKEKLLRQNIDKLFYIHDIPEYAIEEWPDPDKDTPPGRVVSTPKLAFWFNFYQGRHNAQDMDFLILHEAIPGHIYSNIYSQAYDNNAFGLSIYTYHGLSEGWGAYVEELGEPLGLYQTPYDLLGKLKFDLVRSVRVVLDVGINYYGWTNQQALDYWHANIQGQDAIAQREIDRVRRWPGQAVSYKVGADTILTLKDLAQATLGEKFDPREFHHHIIGYGGIPLFLVEKKVKRYVSNKLTA